MRISALRTRILAFDGSAWYGDAPVPAGESARWEYTLTTVSTDEGVEGLTMGIAPFHEGRVIAHAIDDVYRSFLVGADALDREATWLALRRRTGSIHTLTEAVVGILDVALWDIAGKVADLPIAALLGIQRTSVPTYATSSFGLATPDACAAEAVAVRDAGYHGYKLQLADGPERDIPRLRAVRAAVGAGYPLMHDPVAGYTFTEALEVGRVLDELGFHWYEEPIPAHPSSLVRRLADELATPILGTETAPLADLPEYLRTGAADLLRGDVLIKAGITGLRKAIAACELFGYGLEIHTTTTPLLDVANLHVACATPASEFLEAYRNPVFRFGLRDDPLVADADGFVHLPTGPGLGVEIDWDWVDDHTIGVVG